MPSSHHAHIVDALDFVRRINPMSVLDIGIGYGRWGFLFREFLDVIQGRLDACDWKTRIDGIEIWEPYIGDYHRYIYDSIYIDNIVFFVDKMENYDLIFMGDVLEHISKGAATAVLDKLFNKCKYLLLNIPIGKAWLKQGALFGNPYETHVSAWEPQDFVKYSMQCPPKSYICNGKPIIFYIFRGAL